jgi:hypothetical protein
VSPLSKLAGPVITVVVGAVLALVTTLSLSYAATAPDRNVEHRIQQGKVDTPNVVPYGER